MARYKIEGMKELEWSIKRLGKLPKSSVTQAAKSGAYIALRAAKSKAPEDTGQLRSGIVIDGERTSRQGKKVYDVKMDPAKNDIFQKATNNGIRRQRIGKKVKLTKGNYYYPASQEYGFVSRKGRYIPGYHFLKDGLQDNRSAVERKIVEVLSKKIDKELKKG